jgi:CheY-like chemotaxis protein
MKILIVEDNIILCGMIEKWLQKAGYEVLAAIDEPGARNILKKNEINLVLGDVRLPEGDGISLLEWMMRSKMEVPFIVMTDYACIKDAVRAIKLGAKDYLQKPVHQELMIELVHSMLKQPVIVRKERSFVERTSEAARKAASLARRVAPSDLSVMILGPSGSGKEVIAQMIHRYSDRRDKPFVAVNCGSIPNDIPNRQYISEQVNRYIKKIEIKEYTFKLEKDSIISNPQLSSLIQAVIPGTDLANGDIQKVKPFKLLDITRDACDLSVKRLKKYIFTYQGDEDSELFKYLQANNVN